LSQTGVIMHKERKAVYLTTMNGAVITKESGVPTLTDMAYALSRQPRWAGHTEGWWSLADHSVFVAQMAGDDARLALAGLLHDAHEALTGDVPTPFKSDELREVQKTFDRRIFDAYFPGGYAAALPYLEKIKALDARCIYAEAMVIGPYSTRDAAIIAERYGKTPNDRDVKAMQDAIRVPWAVRKLGKYFSGFLVGHRMTAGEFRFIREFHALIAVIRGEGAPDDRLTQLAFCSA
jgi:hypothetical protein